MEDFREQPRKWVHLPVETKAREFHAKLLLACHLADAGYGVIFGHMWMLRRLRKLLPTGVYFDKGVVPRKAKHFREHRRLGNRTAAWCEEGLLNPSEEDYLARRVSADSLRELDVFFAWGNHQRRIILDRYPEFGDIIHSVGNPRFDLLKPQFRDFFSSNVESLRERFGRLLLVNTNYSLCNHYAGPGAFIAGLRKDGKIRPPMDEAYYEGWTAHKQRLFESFLDVLPRLAKSFPDHKVVIRPHPSENHDVWKEKTAGLANVTVCYEGNVVDWLLAADAVVHNGCTTGIEGYALERPVVAYEPVTSDTYDLRLANDLSYSAGDPEELCEKVASAIDGRLEADPAEAAKKEEIAREHFGGRTGSLACEKIVKQIDEIDVPEKPLRDRSLLQRYREIRYGFGKNKSVPDYVAQKFPGLTTEEIQEAISSFNRISGKFAAVTAEPYRNGTFAIFKALSICVSAFLLLGVCE